MGQIKVTYIGRDWRPSTAYVDEDTLLGENKHSGVAVQLMRSELGTYFQTDTWEWDFDFEGTPTRKK